MTPAQRKKLEKQLRALEQELEQKAPERIPPSRIDEHQVGSDEDEQPLTEMLQSIASSRNRQNAAMLGRVRKALRKLADDPDEYGLCEQCEEEIDLRRLEAMPFAELCTGCQSARDARRGPGTRRKLTDYD